MKAPYYIFVSCLLCGVAFAQDKGSKLESRIPPAQLRKLVKSRDQAQIELNRANTDTLSPMILNALESEDPLALVKLDQVQVTDGQVGFTVNLSVDKLLRGSVPQKMIVQCYWSRTPWVLRPPLGAQHIKPQVGRRMFGKFATVDKTTLFTGILDLDDPAEAAFLPVAIAALDMDAAAAGSGISSYLGGLSSKNTVVRDLAVYRLVHSKEYPANPLCERAILAQSQNLLSSHKLTERKEAVEWLGQLSNAMELCQIRSCGMPQFQPGPVRLQLQAAIRDKNVAIGDEAFEVLAQFDFNKPENAGYCAEIVPSLRTVERYKQGTQHPIGGSLSVASSCIWARRAGHGHKGTRGKQR